MSDEEKDQTELDKEKAESKRDEAEDEGTGGSSILDDEDTANAKDAGKAEAEADRATAENAKDDE